MKNKTMCLTTTWKKGFIAQTDIIVFYKQLEKRNNGGWEVTLDTELIPDQSSPEILERSSHNFAINGGTIHAYLQTSGNKNYHYFKAIIKAGTRFWLQDDLSEVCTERLYLTSEEVIGKEKTDLSTLFPQTCLNLLSKDGKRIKWTPSLKSEDVKGIYAYEDQAVGLEVYESVFSSESLRNIPGQIDSRGKAEKDMDGRGRTDTLKKMFPGAEILKDLPEDSYIPAAGELTKALENLVPLNLTRVALGLKPIPYYWFWTSTPYDENFLWYVDPEYDYWSDWRWYDGDWSGYHVLPFVALIK